MECNCTKKLHALTEMSSLNDKKITIIFRYNELPGIFSPLTAEMCKPLRRLTSSKCELTQTAHTKAYIKELKISSKILPWHSTI